MSTNNVTAMLFLILAIARRKIGSSTFGEGAILKVPTGHTITPEYAAFRMVSRRELSKTCAISRPEGSMASWTTWVY